MKKAALGAAGSEFIQVGGGGVVLQVIPGKVAVNDRVNIRGDGMLGMENLLIGAAGSADDGPGLGLALPGFALELGHRLHLVMGLGMGLVRALHSFFGHNKFTFSFQSVSWLTSCCISRLDFT